MKQVKNFMFTWNKKTDPTPVKHEIPKSDIGIKNVIETQIQEKESISKSGEDSSEDMRVLLNKARQLDKVSSRTSCAEIAIKRELITKDQLVKILNTQGETGGYFHQILADMGFVPREKILDIAAEEWGLSGFIDLAAAKDIDPEVVKLISESKARRNLSIPIYINGTKLSVAMANPLNILNVDDLRINLKTKGFEFDIEPLLAFPKDIEKKLEETYGLNDTLVQSIIDEIQGDQILVESMPEEEQEDEIDIARSVEAAQKGPIISLVNAILLNAVKMRATDVHIEPFRKRTVLRFRIDSRLQEIPKIPMPKARHAAIISRIKIMAGCDIAERRLPQDGRIQFTAAGREYDVRVSIIPTSSFGEAVVMRLADRASTGLSLTQLGFSPINLKLFQDTISRPHGMILVTGPTGSGKTTTLYSALNTINTPEVKILTVENPVERYLESAIQVQVKPEIGLDFAEALRSFLRHDPDVIMVGEIRDKETATTAIEAALTGHLVFATLHTNDAPSSIIRLIEMGINEFLLASSVQSCMAQRLVRKICKDCAVSVAPTSRILKEMQACNVDTANLKLQRGLGCNSCSGSGFRGVTAIHEVLKIDDDMVKLILKGDFSGPQLRDMAKTKGMRNLREDGMEKAAKGLTTFEEIILKTMEL